MGQINDLFTQRLTPKMAIIVYNSNDNHYYLEEREIREGRMCAGIPLTEKKIADIIDTLAKYDGVELVHGRIPECLLYADSRAGHEKYVWYRKPEKHRLYFSKNLGIEDGEMWVPGLVWVLKNGKLSMYAYKGRKPGKLYCAPFFNVYPDYVCLGSAKAEAPKEMTYEAIIAYYEELFWNSAFSHLGGGNPVKGNLSMITKNCIKTGCRFPEEELVPVKVKLEDLLK